ncbi:hypothetical protein E2C01_072745 [Portunus trituberculatus]|uniref:Uncharacterized protein n=1 Tax=Portunus trituberculatus TaxID=210409 RepID=A0A5B7I8N9_PORTR|nr:hypothetical protein [Portunus trituberculatus]
MNKILRSKAPTTGHPSVHSEGQSQVSAVKKRSAFGDKSTKAGVPRGMTHRCYGQKNSLPSDLGIGARGVGGICPKVSHPV